jgi:sigma-B regulation protein RsbU (phosphoserine phosphatase)
MNRGAFDFVTKPIDFEDLKITIQKTWSEVQAFREASSARRQLVSIQKELEVARRIQEATAPTVETRLDGVDLYGFTTPASDISGTFFNFVELSSHRLGFYVGNVESKGIAAALFVAMSQTFLKGSNGADENPGERLTLMNQLLFPDDFPDIAVAVFYGLLDVQTGELAYSNAGHPWPWLIQKDSDIAPLDGKDTRAIWEREDQTFDTDHVRLGPGDRLLICTAGVHSALDAYGKPYSSSRLQQTIDLSRNATSAGVVRDLIRSVMDHVGDAPLSHDLTVMDVRYLGC